MQLEPFVELAADQHRGVERGHRLLEDHADAGAAHGAQVLARHRHHVLALEADRPARQPDGRRDEAHHRPCGQRLARAGFADDTDDLAGEDLEGDGVDQGAAAGAELQREIGDVEEVLDPAKIPLWKAASEAGDPLPEYETRIFFLYVPEGQEEAAKNLLDANKISYAGVRGYRSDESGQISIVPFVTRGNPYDHQ